MNRIELTLAIAAALMLAVLLGWVLRWLFGRLNAPGPREITRAKQLAAELAAAQEARSAAERRLAEVEHAFADQLTQARAELEATLEGLAQARAQAEEIRAAYLRSIAGRGARAE